MSKLVAVVIVAMIVVPANGHGDLHILISKLDQEIARNSTDPDKWLERAMLHCQHDSYLKALADLQEVEKLAPARPERHYVAARVYMRQEKWPQAQAALGQHLLALPGNSQSLFLRSQVHIKQGKPVDAEKDLIQAIKLHPKAPLNYFRSLIEVQKEQHKIDQAIQTGHSARKVWGDLPNMLMMQARLLREHGLPKEASQFYHEIKKQSPSLTFSTCLEEAEMWRNLEPQKSLDLIQQAEAAWNSFSLRKRDRAPMQKLHRELITMKQQLS